MTASRSSSSGPTKGFIALQMLGCVSGIYFCFGLWSVQQERILTKPYRSFGSQNEGGMELFPGVWFISLFQSAAGVVVALLALAVLHTFQLWRSEELHTLQRSKRTQVTRSVAHLTLVGFTSAFGTSLGMAAMRLLPFPVVLAAKMGKMIPTMVIGYLWYGARYELQRVVACIALSVGVYAFYALDASNRSESESGGRRQGEVGFLLLFIALVLDGVTNSTQDLVAKRLQCSGPSLMALTNLSAVLWLSLGMLLMESSRLESLIRGSVWDRRVPLHDWSRSISFIQRHPDCGWDIVVLCLVNGVGQVFIFFTITLFGCLTMTAMTLVRKAGSVGVSILVHGHTVRPAQMVALLLTLASVVWDARLSINRASRQQRNAERMAEKSAKRRQSKKQKQKHTQDHSTQTLSPLVKRELKPGTTFTQVMAYNDECQRAKPQSALQKSKRESKAAKN